MINREASNMKNVKSISMSKSLLRSLNRYSTQAYPKEACGLVFGKIKDESINILEFFHVRNFRRSSIGFAISESDLQSSIKQSRFALMGIFHSHPCSEMKPSPIDIQNMKKRELIWLIAGCKPRKNRSREFKIGAYLMIDDRLEKIKIIIERGNRQWD